MPRISNWLGDHPRNCHNFLVRPKQPLIFPDQALEQVEVAIVGAGLSGLTAAYYLRDLQPAVYEANDQPGGVCLTGSLAGMTYPAGSAYCYYPWNEDWRRFYRELGLEMDDYLIAAPASAMWLANRWLPECYRLPAVDAWPVPAADRQGFKNLIQDLARSLGEEEILGRRSLPCPELDRYTLAAYLEEIRGLSPALTRLLAPYCRSCLGAGPETISAWAALYFLLSEFDPDSRLVAFPAGNAEITSALIRALPQAVRRQQTVVALRPVPAGVQLLIWSASAYRFYCLEAKKVILAAGKQVAARLLGDRWGWQASDWQRFHYSSYVVAALAGSFDLGAPGYENWIPGEPEFSDFILLPRPPEPGRAQILVLYAPQPYPAGRRALVTKTAPDQAASLLQALDRQFPGVQGGVREVQLYRFGHAQILALPGFNTWLRQEFALEHDPIYLAGADSEGLPCIEAAIVQGRQAALRVRAALGR